MAAQISTPLSAWSLDTYPQELHFLKQLLNGLQREGACCRKVTQRLKLALDLVQVAMFSCGKDKERSVMLHEWPWADALRYDGYSKMSVTTSCQLLEARKSARANPAWACLFTKIKFEDEKNAERCICGLVHCNHPANGCSPARTSRLWAYENALYADLQTMKTIQGLWRIHDQRRNAQKAGVHDLWRFHCRAGSVPSGLISLWLRCAPGSAAALEVAKKLGRQARAR